MALVVAFQFITQPTQAVPTGSFDIRVNTPPGVALVLPVYATMPGPTPTPVVLPTLTTGALYEVSGLAPGAYVASFTDSATPANTLTVAFSILPVVQLLATPPAYAAAHLPCLVVIEAAPISAAGAPAPVLLFIDAASGTNWVQVASLRQLCDPLTNTARFDLSEFLKTQFTPTAPDETGGPDPALAYAYRLRIGVAPGYSGAAGTEALTFTGWAINAAEPINPTASALPIGLTAPAPYASVPAGYARFQTLLTTTGVTNPATVAVGSAAWPCPVRQFVWLTPGGGWAYGFFAGRHEYGTEVGDGTLQRDRFGADRYVRRGDVRRTARVYSDKLTRAVFDVLVGVRDSAQVYERLPTGAYIPVTVEPGNFRDYQDTEKTFTVDFTARYPVLVRQTQ